MKKTPDEIKKGMECCQCLASCDECPYQVYVYGSFGCDECGCENDLLPDALAYIQQLEAKVPRWISVEEMLPEGICIAVNDMGSMIIGYIGEDKGSDTGYSCEDERFYMPSVTHWMPLPEPPEV